MCGDRCIGVTLALLENAFPCHHRVVALCTLRMSFGLDPDERYTNIEVNETLTFGVVVKSRVVEPDKLLCNLVDVCHSWMMLVVEAKG